MEQRTFHGPVTPSLLAQALVAEFDRGEMRAQSVGEGEQVLVQIAGRLGQASGGRTALTVQLSQVEDGVLARLGQQEWLGVAASLGTTALWALKNPWTLLGRLDDLAQDLEAIQLTAHVWETLGGTAGSLGAAQQISDRLRRLTCPYCLSANEVGVPSCIACGAPLGPDQPIACPRCGFVWPSRTAVCANCGLSLSGAA